MAYAFNDDKSKKHIVVITGIISSVEVGGSKTETISASDLSSNYGIDNAFYYAVIGAMTRSDSNNNLYNSDLYPISTRHREDGIVITVENNYTQNVNIYYILVLMRARE